MINNAEASQPHFTVKRDGVLKEFEIDASVAPESLSAELKKRNVESATANPIKVQFEYKTCWNLSLIDTPGFTKTTKPEELEELVLKYARPSHRILVFVEQCRDVEQLESIELAKKLDPKLDRSYFVFTHFDSYIKNFNNSRDLNKFLTSVTSDLQTQSYFVSQLSAEERIKITPGLQGKAAFKEAQIAKLKSNLSILEQLQFDRRYERRVGINQWRQSVHDTTWRRYQEAAPEVLKRLRAFRKNSEEHLIKIKTQLDSMDAPKLRSLASNYVMEFLQSIEKLIVGTLEGSPALNGQTLKEEKQHEDAGEWYDADHRPIEFDPAAWNIPYWDSKLYGGQQFERLLSEFKSVCDHLTLEEVTLHDIATAAGPNRLTTPSNFAWTASDIAQKKTQAALLPLVDQLFNRSIYILKRLVDIVDKMIENKRKAAMRRTGNSGNSSLTGTLGRNKDLAIGAAVINIDDYPYFTHSVKEMYFKFVDQFATSCKTKCIDEFYCTRLIYWELQQDGADLHQFNVDTKDGGEAIRKSVTSLAAKLFGDIRNRIAKNVLLKSYNYFLIPMQTDLWGEVQSKITTLSDNMLEELFEVTVTKAKLKDDEKLLQQILTTFHDQEAVFLEAANSFSHPVW